jgi:ABC-type branched-subunit amino acid transport system ATPase component
VSTKASGPVGPDVTAPDALAIGDLSAGYEGVPVLRGVNLTVVPGQVVALLGPNGAGKTTLLRAVSGIIRPMAGQITVYGNDTARMSPTAVARLGVGHVLEGRGVFSGLTVAEHLRIGLAVSKADEERVLDYFPALTRLYRTAAGLLSGGEQQMLALASALARRPRLLLIDELSLGLAPIIVQQLLPIVRRIAEDTSAGVLLVEQHTNLALEVADRGAVLNHGNLVLDAIAERLRTDRQLLIASYLGSAGRPAPAGNGAGTASAGNGGGPASAGNGGGPAPAGSTTR